MRRLPHDPGPLGGDAGTRSEPLREPDDPGRRHASHRARSPGRLAHRSPSGEARGQDAEARAQRRAGSRGGRLSPHPEIAVATHAFEAPHVATVHRVAAKGLWSWVTTVEHQTFGISYGATGYRCES